MLDEAVRVDVEEAGVVSEEEQAEFGEAGGVPRGDVRRGEGGRKGGYHYRVDGRGGEEVKGRRGECGRDEAEEREGAVVEAKGVGEELSADDKVVEDNVVAPNTTPSQIGPNGS